MDKYDEAIEWLVANPVVKGHDGDGGLWTEIYQAWGNCYDHKAGCLFVYADPGIHESVSRPHGVCGCLTMIRNPANPHVAWTPELTAEIRADARIQPIESIVALRGDALRAALQPFAEWQRRLDKEIRTVATS